MKVVQKVRASWPEKKKTASTVIKLSYNQKITLFFYIFAAGIEALIIVGHQLLYPLVKKGCHLCVFHH